MLAVGGLDFRWVSNIVGLMFCMFSLVAIDVYVYACSPVFGQETVTTAGFPLGLENLENLEKWEGIFQSGKSQGILNRLEKSGKITRILENSGNLR